MADITKTRRLTGLDPSVIRLLALRPDLRPSPPPVPPRPPEPRSFLDADTDNYSRN